MPRLDEIADDIKTTAALAAGREAARRAVGDLLSSEGERAQQRAERDAASKSRRTKVIAYGVVGLLLVLGLLGFVLSYWYWLLLAGLAGAVGLYGWRRLRRRLQASRGPALAPKDESAPARKLRVRDPSDARSERPSAEQARVGDARRAHDPARDALAREQAQAVEEQELDDELAAMKAKLGR